MLEFIVYSITTEFTALQSEERIKNLSDTLFNAATISNTTEQRTLIQNNWERIRELIAQNAGLEGWGSHLKERHFEQLKKEAKSTIANVESLDISPIFNNKIEDLPGIDYLLFNQIKNEHISSKTAEAIFLNYDRDFSLKHCLYLQELFINLVTNDNWKIRDPVISEMFIMNLVGLLPFFGLDSLKEIKLPRFINKAWQLVTYKINNIPLTDSIYAYGLTTADPNNDAYPILIFRGTPYPAMEGFLDAVLSDVHPYKDVGQDLFEKGRKNLDAWMQDKIKVDCCGVSLGGALAHHAARAYGNKIFINGAIAAPGITENKESISGRSFHNYYDLVRHIGYLPESEQHESYIALFNNSCNRIDAHARPMGIEPTILVKINPQYENKTWSRFFANIFKKVGSPVAWFYIHFIIWIKSLWHRLTTS